MEENRNEEIAGGCCLIVLLVFFLVCGVGKTVHDKAVENKMSVTDYSIVKIHKSINHVVDVWNNGDTVCPDSITFVKNKIKN